MVSGEDTPLKLIRYRGGVVCFRIPTDWQELYGLDGGGEFHPDTSDGRALRVRVTTAQAPYVVTTEAAGALARNSNPDAVLLLPSGNVCARATDRLEEDGEQIVLHVWKVYNVLPPHHLRVALFTYTVLASLESTPDVCREVALLDREIQSATFAPELGATPP